MCSFHLHCGDYAAEIVAQGAGIKALSFRNEPLVETYTSTPPMTAGLVLAPWPNRTEDGEFSFDGQHYQLPINEPSRNNALHGLVHEREWELVQRSEDAVTLSCVISEHWVAEMTLMATYQLHEGGLRVRYSVSSQEPAPFALGLHTYLNARGADCDDSELTLNVTEHHLLDERNLLTGEVELEGIAKHVLKGTVWDDLYRAPEPLKAQFTAVGKGVQMRCGAGWQWVQLYTPDDYPGRGRALAVEPMTAPINALRSGTDLVTMGPDESCVFELELAAI